MIIKEENFKWHLEVFASELFRSTSIHVKIKTNPVHGNTSAVLNRTIMISNTTKLLILTFY